MRPVNIKFNNDTIYTVDTDELDDMQYKLKSEEVESWIEHAIKHNLNKLITKSEKVFVDDNIEILKASVENIPTNRTALKTLIRSQDWYIESHKMLEYERLLKAVLNENIALDPIELRLLIKQQAFYVSPDYSGLSPIEVKHNENNILTISIEEQKDMLNTHTPERLEETLLEKSTFALKEKINRSQASVESLANEDTFSEIPTNRRALRSLIRSQGWYKSRDVRDQEAESNSNDPLV